MSAINMITRRSANVKSSNGPLAVKRSFSGLEMPNEMNRQPQDIRNRGEKNPWNKRSTGPKGKPVVKVVEVEKESEEELSAEVGEWKEVKARKRANCRGLALSKPVPVRAVESVAPLEYAEWPELMSIGTPVMFRGLKRSASLNGTPGVVVAVVEQDKRFLVTTEEGITVSVLKEKLSVVEDEDILVVASPVAVNMAAQRDAEADVILTPRLSNHTMVEEVTPKGSLGGTAVATAIGRAGMPDNQGGWASPKVKESPREWGGGEGNRSLRPLVLSNLTPFVVDSR